MLTWEEWEGGQPGQPPLFPSMLKPSIAERAFVHFARMWRHGYETKTSHSPPRAIDEAALAALLLANEHGGVFGKVARQICREHWVLLDGRNMWMDRLPWQLTGCALGIESWPFILELLSCNLTHPSSSLRCWVLQIAWLVRNRLPKDQAIQDLLKNVADTLIGVSMSAGLARALCRDDDEWKRVTTAFQPEQFQEQYRDRIAELNASGLLPAQAELYRVECTVRRMISNWVFAAYTPGGKGSE